MVLFHARLGPFTGGYVGVDIFFVISGFLITSIIVRELATATFTFTDFYQRRIRRIFPALFVVVASCFAAGWFIQTPKDYANLANAAIKTAVFISNIHFSAMTGYFGPAAETQPLLHTWSLAVEEQFYAIAPVALIFLYKAGSRLRTGLFAALAAASLAYAINGVQQQSPAAFYLLQSRAWELMTGMALAMGIVPPVTSKRSADAVSLLGLVMIFYAVLMYSSETPFPGLAALLPCLGAALIIHGGAAGPTWCQSVLSTPAFVFIGKISFSLYLWHWPLLAFAAYEFEAVPGPLARISLIAAAFILAILTWRYVEQPARKSHAQSGASGRTVLASGAAAIFVCLLAALAVKRSDGFAWRLPASAQALMSLTPHTGGIPLNCKRDKQTSDATTTVCLLGDIAASKTTFAPAFAIWGDSHAAAVGGEFSNIAKAEGASGLLQYIPGCPPLLGLNALSQRSFNKCLPGQASIAKLLENHDIADVVLVARWAMYAEGSVSANELKTNVRRFVEGDAIANRAAFSRLLRETVSTITASGRRVTIIGPVPELPFDLPSVVIKDIMRARARNLTLPRAEFDARQAFVMQELADLERIPNTRVLYPHHVLCDHDICKTSENGVLLYTDEDHLSPYAVGKLAAMFREIFKPPGTSGSMQP